jgi:hypothetical protein
MKVAARAAAANARAPGYSNRKVLLSTNASAGADGGGEACARTRGAGRGKPWGGKVWGSGAKAGLGSGEASLPGSANSCHGTISGPDQGGDEQSASVHMRTIA